MSLSADELAAVADVESVIGPVLLGGGMFAFCEWFTGCQYRATTSVWHPILGDVPACERCRGIARP